MHSSPVVSLPSLATAAAVALLALPTLAPDAQDPAPLTWDNLEERMAAEESAGFSGAVVVVRDDEVVLDRGYGLANREEGLRVTPETVFGIGSTPIDFTKASILLLAERGKLALDDPITKFFEDVPADKRAITIRHLMTGASGLQNFHDVPEDRDPDHSWIDRAEAVRRILGGELLFAPGEGEEHSHSAWGLLAAIVEIASGESYAEFTREHLFTPAGMRATGFFGEPVPHEHLAIGYGDRRDGEVNAPPYWGPTSWLVMGSGGMVSTTGDMLRWNRALRSGRLLSKASLADYWAPPGAVLDGGDMYGFLIVYTEGPGTLMIVTSNSDGGERLEPNQRLARDLARLVLDANRPKYSLGVELGVGDEPGPRVERVLPGSAAEVGGLKVGDVLESAGGKPLGRRPMAVLDPLLRAGAEIRFGVLRGGEHVEVLVQPTPR